MIVRSRAGDRGPWAETFAVLAGGDDDRRTPRPGGLAQREMVEEPQGQGGLDGEIRVPPLPAPPAAPAGCPGSDRLRGHPHRHIAASNEGLVIGRPVRNAVLCLVPGMDLRLHPCSVAPAEGPEKCGPRRPTRSGYSCNNASPRREGSPPTSSGPHPSPVVTRLFCVVGQQSPCAFVHLGRDPGVGQGVAHCP